MTMTDNKSAVMAQPALVWKQMYCSACRGKLMRVAVVTGSTVAGEDRCHHSVIDDDGKRRTCKVVTRVVLTG